MGTYTHACMDKEKVGCIWEPQGCDSGGCLGQVWLNEHSDIHMCKNIAGIIENQDHGLDGVHVGHRSSPRTGNYELELFMQPSGENNAQPSSESEVCVSVVHLF
jgi:hypothetical protein